MRHAMTRLNVNDARREALFASGLERSDAPAAESVAAAISRAVRRIFSHAGLWTKPRVCCAAFSTAITKHTRSGPRLGNGALVYLTEIGSI